MTGLYIFDRPREDALYADLESHDRNIFPDVQSERYDMDGAPLESTLVCRTQPFAEWNVYSSREESAHGRRK